MGETIRMGLNIRMRMFNSVKHLDVIYLKFEERFFTSAIVLGFESKGSTSSIIKENLILYCRKISAFAVAAII